MPYLSNLNREDELNCLYLDILYNSVMLKDIIKRNTVRDVELLEKIISISGDSYRLSHRKSITR